MNSMHNGSIKKLKSNCPNNSGMGSPVGNKHGLEFYWPTQRFLGEQKISRPEPDLIEDVWKGYSCRVLA